MKRLIGLIVVAYVTGACGSLGQVPGFKNPMVELAKVMAQAQVDTARVTAEAVAAARAEAKVTPEPTPELKPMMAPQVVPVTPPLVRVVRYVNPCSGTHPATFSKACIERLMKGGSR